MRRFISLLVTYSIALFAVTHTYAHEQHNKPVMPIVDTEEEQALASGSIVSLDIKYVNNTAHLLTGEIKQDQHMLWHQTSTDQGKSWSQPVDAFAEFGLQARMIRGMDAQFAVQGDNIVAVWTKLEKDLPYDSGPMMSVRSADGGQHWQQSLMPADWNGPHGFFALDSSENRISLVWLDNREKAEEGAQGLRFTSSIDGGVSWTKDATLDAQTCACCWNTVQFNDSGDFYVLYRDKKPSDMALGRVDKQQQWQRLNTVGAFNWDFDGCPHIGGGLAIDNNKNQLHATVGTALEEKPGVYYLNSSNDGLNWSDPLQLGDDSAVHSNLAITETGILLASWDRLTEFGFEIVYILSHDQGASWSAPTLLSAPQKPSSHPKAIGMADSFLIAWTETDEVGNGHLRKQIIADPKPKKEEPVAIVNDFVKGSFSHIQQQNEGSPYLILFWSETCAYCMKELAEIGQLAAAQKSAFKLVTVSTDPNMDKTFIRQKLTSLNLPDAEAWVFSTPHAETLYFDVDKRWRGELPLSFLFDQQNNKTKKMGMLKQSDLSAWLASLNHATLN